LLNEWKVTAKEEGIVDDPEEGPMRLEVDETEVGFEATRIV